MTPTTHDLILTPILRLQMAQGRTEAGILINLSDTLQAIGDLFGV